MTELELKQERLIEQYKESIKAFQQEIERLESDLAEKDGVTKRLYEQIGDKSKIVVSRMWHKPEITVEYNYLGIRIFMSGEDFIKAVIRETEPIIKPQGVRKFINLDFPELSVLEAKLLKGVDKVVEEMKLATVHFPPPIILQKELDDRHESQS